MSDIGDVRSTMEPVTLMRQASATSELMSFREAVVTYIRRASLNSTPVTPSEAWEEELDFKIAMRRRGEDAGASLKEMAKKYGL
jgi:hypothetical protein